jgi:hypothetical protein
MAHSSRLQMKDLLIGFGLSGVFLVMLLWFNIAGLGSLIVGTAKGWLVAVAIWIVNGFVFSRVQSALAGLSMNDDDDDDDHRGGRRSEDMKHDHAVVRVPVEKRRGPF